MALVVAQDFRRPWLLVVAALATTPACGGNDAGAEVVGVGGAASSTPSLVFRPATTLTLEPRETRELTVVVTPPSRYTVHLSLLSGSTGEGPYDAVLDRGELRTDELGVGHAELTAPSAPVTFSVRASIDGGAHTTLGVSVSAIGHVELEVSPSYSGKRPVEGWVATARAGVTCDDPQLAGTPPPDGDLQVEGATASELVLPSVPVGPVLAVTARAGHYIGGCATVTGVKEGERNRVIVPVSDRPIQLGATRLGIGFAFDETSLEWDDALAEVRGDMLAALRDGAGDDLGALLDALETVVPEDARATVVAAREQRGWDAALHAAYPADEAYALSNTAEAWLQEGFASLFAADAVRAELVSEEEDPERAILTMLEVAGQDAQGAGMPASAPAAWSSDSHDVVLVSSNLLWSPQRLLAALALGPAQSASPTAENVERALANRLSCSLFAGTLIGAGEPQGELYPSCTQQCAITHCRSAVSAVWRRAAAAGEDQALLLSLSASGAAQVGDGAEVVSLTGSWVGRFSAEKAGATAAGPFNGSALD